LHAHVVRSSGRIEIHCSSGKVCVLISKAELESLEQAIEILSQDKIDAAALENLRVQQIRLAEREPVSFENFLAQIRVRADQAHQRRVPRFLDRERDDLGRLLLEDAHQLLQPPDLVHQEHGELSDARRAVLACPALALRLTNR